MSKAKKHNKVDDFQLVFLFVKDDVKPKSKLLSAKETTELKPRWVSENIDDILTHLRKLFHDVYSLGNSFVSQREFIKSVGIQVKAMNSISIKQIAVINQITKAVYDKKKLQEIKIM